MYGGSTMFDLFGWLRRKAREAVLGGISDAVSEVSTGDTPDLERLRALLAGSEKVLPPAAATVVTDAKEEAEPAKPGGKKK
jgi:hypothetical protein